MGRGVVLESLFTHLLLVQINYFERLLSKFETCRKEVLCIHAKLPLWGMCYLPVYSYKNELSKLLNIAHYDQELCRFAFNLRYTVIHKRVMVCTGYDQYNLLILLHDDTCTVCDAGRFAVHQRRGFYAEL